MQIDLVASLPHYRAHLLPIFEALPDRLRGHDFGGSLSVPTDRVIMVAGYNDVMLHPYNRYVYVEHGAGQNYVGINHSAAPSYSGGHSHRNVIGFICPNNDVAGRWNTTYPNIPTSVVGSPRLDPWHSGQRGSVEDRTVAITFHWDAVFTGVHATTSAFIHYYSELSGIISAWKADGWTVLGHWHPRYPAVGEFWESIRKETGIEVVANADEILDRASVLIADNTSMQADFLSLGRPVVWLNHPAYYLDQDHGGRFWVWPTYGGQMVNSPQELQQLELDKLPPVTAHPYAKADGLASQRAASAIAHWLA